MLGRLETATAILGDLIDLALDNSVRWPAPRRIEAAPQAPRRHYLRVTAEPHAGLPRRIDSLVRRAGLTVQNRASRGEPLGTHHGFVLSESSGAAVAELVEQLRGLGRVEQTLALGVIQ